MKAVCPHCGNHREFGSVISHVPNDAIVVLSCPACHELAVAYRSRVVAAKRDILERGTKEERKHHIAEIVGEFLERGSLPWKTAKNEDLKAHTDADLEFMAGEDEEDPELEEVGASLITQREVDRFLKTELHRIDDAVYFKRHFS